MVPTKHCAEFVPFIQPNSWMWIETFLGHIVKPLACLSSNFIVGCGLKRSLAWKALRHQLSSSLTAGCGLKLVDAVIAGLLAHFHPA